VRIVLLRTILTSSTSVTLNILLNTVINVIMMLRYDTSDDKWSYQYHVRVIFHLHAFLVIVIISSVFFHLHNEYVLRQSNLSYKKYDSLDETAKHSLFKDFQAKFDRTVIVIISPSHHLSLHLTFSIYWLTYSIQTKTPRFTIIITSKHF